MKYKNSKYIGDKFEIEFASMLHHQGFWVHRIVPKADGSQPADIIAVKNGEAFLIDCKACENDRFDFSRVEENQMTAMEMWICRGNAMPWFALQISDGTVYMIDFDRMMYLGKGQKKSMNADEIKKHLIKFEDWCNKWSK